MNPSYRQEEKKKKASSRASSPTEEDQILCYSPENQDQRQRFCDLLALAIPSIALSRELRASAKQEDDESDTESHPSLQSGSEAELLDLCGLEDEDVEQLEPTDDDSERQQNVDFSIDDRLVSRNKVFTSYSENHSSFERTVAPELVFLVKQVFMTQQMNSNNMLGDDGDNNNSNNNNRRNYRSSTIIHSNEARGCKLSFGSTNRRIDFDDQQPEPRESVEANSLIMEHLRELVYKSVQRREQIMKKAYSVSESINSSVLSETDDLSKYRSAFEWKEASPEPNAQPDNNRSGLIVSDTFTSIERGATPVQQQHQQHSLSSSSLLSETESPQLLLPPPPPPPQILPSTLISSAVTSPKNSENSSLNHKSAAHSQQQEQQLDTTANNNNNNNNKNDDDNNSTQKKQCFDDESSNLKDPRP